MTNKKELKVLIIDDDDVMRSFLRMMLREAKVEYIDEVGTAAKANKVIIKNKYNLIFLDINLPDIDGVKFIADIKQKSPDTSIIMISGEATTKRVKQAMQAGARDFIAKPFNAAIIESKAKQLLNELNNQ